MIKVENLTKRYGVLLAVDEATFEVAEGTITAFIGENGAGKSTTLRGILNLTPMDKGKATIFGMEYKNIKNPSQSIGVVLDASKLHHGRSGYTIMKISALLSDTCPSKIPAVLEMCGLTMEQSHKKVKTYSLGMKQRLCIAQALLSMPSILILDEPINGLDPQGIRWIRKVLRQFADEGGTVLISSHLLSEMEKIADCIVMIKDGKILKQEALKSLLSEGSNLEEVYLEYTVGKEEVYN